MYEQAQQPGAQVVYLVDSMIKCLFALESATKRFVHPKKVAIHKANRDGLGVVEESVHGILVDIDGDGFVWSAVDEACAFEDALDRRHAKFTADMCNSEPALASFRVDEIEIAGVACVHTNQALAAAIDGVPTEHESIAFDGHISTAKLSAKNANMSAAIEHGLKWTIIPRWVDEKYPALADLIQRAKNKVGQTQRRPTMWQTIAHISKLAVKSAATRSNGNVDW